MTPSQLLVRHGFLFDCDAPLLRLAPATLLSRLSEKSLGACVWTKLVRWGAKPLLAVTPTRIPTQAYARRLVSSPTTSCPSKRVDSLCDHERCLVFGCSRCAAQANNNHPKQLLRTPKRQKDKEKMSKATTKAESPAAQSSIARRNKPRQVPLKRLRFIPECERLRDSSNHALLRCNPTAYEKAKRYKCRAAYSTRVRLSDGASSAPTTQSGKSTSSM